VPTDPNVPHHRKSLTLQPSQHGQGATSLPTAEADTGELKMPMPVPKMLNPEQMANEANLEWSIKFAINCLEQTAADLDLRLSIPTLQANTLRSMMGLKYDPYNKLQTAIDQLETQKQ